MRFRCWSRHWHTFHNRYTVWRDDGINEARCFGEMMILFLGEEGGVPVLDHPDHNENTRVYRYMRDGSQTVGPSEYKFIKV